MKSAFMLCIDVLWLEMQRLPFFSQAIIVARGDADLLHLGSLMRVYHFIAYSNAFLTQFTS